MDSSIASLLAQSLQDLGKNFNVTQFNEARQTPTDVAFQWSWRENDGQFIPFDPDQNYQIEVAYIKYEKKGKIIVTGDLAKQKNNYSYEVNFDNMTELNTQFKSNPRPIKREPKNLDKNIWEVETVSGWLPLDQLANKQTQLAFERKTPSIVIDWNHVNGTARAEITFATMTLSCNSTAYRIRRRERDFEDELRKSINPEVSVSVSQFETTQTKTKKTVTLRGLQTDLQVGEAYLLDLIKKMTTTVLINLEARLTDSQVTELQRLAAQYDAEIVENLKENKLSIKAIDRVIAQARADIMEYLLSTASSQSKVKYPANWEPQTDTCELKPVQRGTPEWNGIEQRMKETLPSVQIFKIERVQNTLLWEKYCFHKHILERKNNGNANEKRLFHGTRGTPPPTIYTDEAGFDMRFSGNGMWGIAIYFAQNASYSNGYSSSTSDGYKQMFMPSVLVGDCIHIMPNNGSLRKPPSKTTNNGISIFYDAVSGDTGGSTVYMIYENGRAYPDYLITYKVYVL
jgi:hypothetical protein